MYMYTSRILGIVGEQGREIIIQIHVHSVIEDSIISHGKNYLLQVGLEPKTYCILVHVHALPVQRHRKFSHVLGLTFVNSSNTIRPAG